MLTLLRHALVQLSWVETVLPTFIGQPTLLKDSFELLTEGECSSTIQRYEPHFFPSKAPELEESKVVELIDTLPVAHNATEECGLTTAHKAASHNIQPKTVHKAANTWAKLLKVAHKAAKHQNMLGAVGHKATTDPSMSRSAHNPDNEVHDSRCTKHFLKPEGNTQLLAALANELACGSCPFKRTGIFFKRHAPMHVDKQYCLTALLHYYTCGFNANTSEIILIYQVTTCVAMKGSSRPRST